MVAQLFWVGYRRVFLPYKRRKREQGVSGWNFRKRLSYMLDSIVSFSSLPISLLFWFGVMGISTSVCLAAIVLIAWALGSMEVKGYTPLMLVIVFFGSLQLLTNGIVGFYIWRIFENTKCRPSSFVKMDIAFTPTKKAEYQ